MKLRKDNDIILGENYQWKFTMIEIPCWLKKFSLITIIYQVKMNVARASRRYNRPENFRYKTICPF